MRRPAAIAALVASLLALAACGGGAASSSTTARITTDPAPAPSPPRPKLSRAALRRARAERRVAGRAAPFVRPESDNSVPTFGSEAGAAERAAAEASLRRYLSARARKDWVAACRDLAKPTREGFEKLDRTGAKGCAPVLAALTEEAGLGDPLAAGLLSLRVQGRHAFALFYGPGQRQYMVPMNLEDRRWRPTQAAPIAYPPGTSG
jgi:hypothetical protein